MREGAQAVVVTGRRPEAGEKFVAELAEQGATARFVQTDVSATWRRPRRPAQTVDVGRVDRPVNSAWS